MCRYKAYSPEDILRDSAFRDAIKKAYLLQLLKYGKCRQEEELKLSVNGNNDSILIRDGNELLYPLCGYVLNKKLGHYWEKEQVVNRILSTPKSGYDRRFASLFALVTSRAKTLETERFIYLWIAMNALYGYVSEKGKRSLPKEGIEWIKKEFAQLKFFSLIMGYQYRSLNKGKTIDEKKQNNHLLFSLERLCASIPSENTSSFVFACQKNDCSNQWVDEIHKLLKEFNADEDIHPYMLVLLWLPYQIRCKYFHGEATIPFLCFSDEHPIPALKVVNQVLDNFLDNNLPHWFMEECQEHTIESIAKACTFKKDYFESCSTFSKAKILLYF